MIRRFAALALLLPSLSGCCCPRADRCCSTPCEPCEPCGPSGPSRFRVLGEPARPPALLGPGPGLTVRIEKLNPTEPIPLHIDFEPPAPTAASREASKPVLVVHAVSDLVGGDAAKMETLLGKVRPIAANAGESASAQGLVAIIVKAPPFSQSLVKALLNDERSAAGLAAPPSGPPPVAPPDPVDASALKLMYFDVSDLIAPGTPAPDGSPPPSGPGAIDPAKQDALLATIRPLAGDGEGRMFELRNRTLIVKAPRAALDAIRARLEAMRGAK